MFTDCSCSRCPELREELYNTVYKRTVPKPDIASKL